MFGYHQEQLYANKLRASTTNSISQLPQLDAVIIRNLNYIIGRGRNKRVILNRINLTVPEGSIYGLLGPSGCGKTTMLRCVVGRIKPRDGQSQVLVFGLGPGEGRGEVPGRAVGYMPQEISIYEDFTIEETLLYFGRINRMQHSEIKKRIEFLLQFLDLPSKKRLVVNLSGGQKRRVSLAAALVHSPPLLILDEPTVGVDPLLRQSIWQHLVTLTQTERISVIITTHYIEEARQANVVGLMRHGKMLAENSPDELMRIHKLSNLEEVFLKLCVTDSSRRAASLAVNNNLPSDARYNNGSCQVPQADFLARGQARSSSRVDSRGGGGGVAFINDYSHRWDSLTREQRLEIMSIADRQLQAKLFTRPIEKLSTDSSETSLSQLRKSQTKSKAPIVIHTATNKIELNHNQGYDNEVAIENLSSEDEAEFDSERNFSGTNHTRHQQQRQLEPAQPKEPERINFRQLIEHAGPGYHTSPSTSDALSTALHTEDYLALQSMKWAARRSNALNLMSLKLNRGSRHNHRRHIGWTYENDNGLNQWFKTLMAVTWKNYIRLRRNPPVLIFQFMLPAIQVILFCLCIGGDPFDVPVAIVNDEIVPRSSQQFLDGLNRKIIRQIKYDNLTSAIEAVRQGTVWGAIHIPDKYSQNLQSRLIMGEEVTNETISNGTIRVYPDLTNLHLALALETTFRETFINFARNSLEELGYDPSLANLPIQIGQPVYGSMKKDGYLEFMAPGVVISISYVMATGLTALAFILERRDGLLERSLVSGVQTSQILLAHAINQVVVMIIQIFLVLGCTFFVFEIPSRGSFFLVILLILLQGCTGMGFGLLVSAICKEENTAVMMVVGTFYTNLILAGIIWPIEAMPHWLRPLSYAQPQTLPTNSLRHILSRGWGLADSGVLLGFAVTLGWLVIFLMAAGIIFKYIR